MQSRRAVAAVSVILLAAGVVAADTKIVKATHTDGFQMMGQQQPAKDEESVTWLGNGRLQVNQDGSSFIVRPDQKKMYIVNHGDKTYFELDLPIDISKMLPPGMAEQMMQMMKFDATVTPTQETKKVGPWTARRYDVSMKSAMMQMTSQVWSTTDLKLDFDAFKSMSEQIMLMQPGMADLVAEMGKIDGIQVASEGTMTMMGANVKMSERTVSVDEATPPPGTYEVPAGYAKQAFDFMKMQQIGK